MITVNFSLSFEKISHSTFHQLKFSISGEKWSSINNECKEFAKDYVAWMKSIHGSFERIALDNI